MPILERITLKRKYERNKKEEKRSTRAGVTNFIAIREQS